MVTQSEQQIESTFSKIIRLLRWNKPEGRLILMIPGLWAVFLAAQGKPPLPLVGVIILGTLATSAVGCVVNDLWDKDIDPEVERTKNRPLASRTLSIKVGVVVAIVGMVCAAILAFYLNPLSFWLCVAAVPVILLYPGAKRVFPVPQLVLSIAWGFAVLISWSAVTQNLSQPTWLLWGATVLWTLGFDTVYAMSDRDDDKRIGVNSSALFFGNYVQEAIAVFFIATVALLFWLGIVTHLHIAFWISVAIAFAGWIWQYLRLKQPDLPTAAYGEMFRENVWIGFILLAGMMIGSF
ncbi:4-hydroxybenzoate solanesyltransferase [Plectonema cf. radiosum LEGE 06105]|uniref:4-hydroxybenzoate solanesyltransferase n=1 Tax=Plectonema cf. radiosum LEGE 06105 TaxID=945769 RepID=A0A8J7K147_9CYAN|nr:4-hydroxybenzoate solanesyltransferase [Plectonema radiosum]MBE9214456.1 4-hydroxybenzoate solanesyltransferase [Plectonema cf. radiosum LEGE 06105]